MAAPRSRRMAAIFNIKLMFYVVMPCLFLKYVQSARLSDPKILLPYHSSAVVNYTLHVNLTRDEVKFTDSSCFTWYMIYTLFMFKFFPLYTFQNYWWFTTPWNNPQSCPSHFTFRIRPRSCIDGGLSGYIYKLQYFHLDSVFNIL
jgi:hypothetical protein